MKFDYAAELIIEHYIPIWSNYYFAVQFLITSSSTMGRDFVFVEYKMVKILIRISFTFYETYENIVYDENLFDVF